jgi:hypothetical protein
MLCFALLYCSFTFYILPTIAANLKTRKTMLSTANTNSLGLLYPILSSHFISVNEAFVPLQASYPSLHNFGMKALWPVCKNGLSSSGLDTSKGLLFTVSDWAYSLLHPNKLTSFKAYRLI